jgi:hypothetical protein
MVKYFYLEPEVAGGFGEGSVLDTSVHPPKVVRLHYVFDDWLGDDLVESAPCFIITDRLRDKLQRSDATGYKLDQVAVSKSELYEDLHPNGPPLPKFHWLKITGRAGLDDFGIASDRRLVVSELALRLLQSCQLADCYIEDFP